ncbi:MAG: hypothetical protein ABJA90_05925 [Ginsengibacter sp.]
MLRAILYFLFSVCWFSKSYAQVTPSDKQIMDSLIQNDEFLKMLNKMDDTESYFRINIGIGNRLSGGNNKSVQNLETKNQLVFTPSVGYFHKSGLSLSFAGYLLSDHNSLNFYQYALSPSYSFSKGKVADALLSYIHYFKESTYNASASPFNDEIYASLIFKKPFIKPGFSASYSSGRYKEIIKVDTTVIILNRPTLIKYIDTTTTKISSFSISANIEHDFSFYKLLSKKDGLRFTPQLSLISGVNNYSVSHQSSTQFYNLFTKRQLKRLRRFQSPGADSKFELQSIGLDFDFNYSIGKIYVEPEVYFDYFLPKTDDKAFTQVYNFNIGITF